MTDDPQRWLSDDGGDMPERELLASVRDARPPSDAKERAWRGIATSIAAGAAAASIAPSAAAATVTKAGAVAASTMATKVMWTVAAASIAASGYLAAQRVWSEPTAPQQRAPVAQVPPAVKAPVVEDEPQRIAAPEVLDAPREPEATRAAPRVKRKSPLAAESELITRARAALQAGDASAAEVFLQQMRAEFPRSVLEQEREVLSIEVLAARGDLAGAKQRARRFAAAHPSSLHSARLRSLLDTP